MILIGYNLPLTAHSSAYVKNINCIISKNKYVKQCDNNGITEAVNNKGDELLVQGLKNILQKNNGLSPKREAEKTVMTIQQTTSRLNDDLTLLVIG